MFIRNFEFKSDWMLSRDYWFSVSFKLPANKISLYLRDKSWIWLVPLRARFELASVLQLRARYASSQTQCNFVHWELKGHIRTVPKKVVTDILPKLIYIMETDYDDHMHLFTKSGGCVVNNSVARVISIMALRSRKWHLSEYIFCLLW